MIHSRVFTGKRRSDRRTLQTFMVMTFAIENGLFGNNPHISHFINILLYAFTGMLLFSILSSLLISNKIVGNSYSSIPFLASLLFIASPNTHRSCSKQRQDEIMALVGSLFTLFFTMKLLTYEYQIFALFFCLLLSVFYPKKMHNFYVQ